MSRINEIKIRQIDEEWLDMVKELYEIGFRKEDVDFLKKLLQLIKTKKIS